MTTDELKQKIADLLKDDRGGAEVPAHQARQKLQELAEAVGASLGPNVEVRLEAGQRMRRGQQYSFVVRVPKMDLRDVLFQAYVPTSGLPVTLDLSDDDQPKCASLDELEAAILRFFAQSDVKQRLLEIRDLAG